MGYDFRADVQAFRDWLLDEVQKYRDLHDVYPHEFPVVTRVEIAIVVGPPTPPTLYLDWDTRPDPKPDDDATFGSVAQLERPEWLALMGEGVPTHVKTVLATFPDGSAHEANVHTGELDVLIGNAVVGLLLAAKAAGAFDRLPAPPDLKLNVTYEGWGWPPHEDDPAPRRDERHRMPTLSARLADAFREKRWADVCDLAAELGASASELDLKRAKYARRMSDAG